MKRYYPAAIERDQDNPELYGVVFPDFLGCVTVGGTMEEAITQAEEALHGHIELMIEDGDSLPEPSKFADIDQEWKDGAEAIAMIPVTIHKKKRANKRYNLSLSPDVVEEVEAVATNKSAFFEMAAREKLKREEASL